MALNQRHGRLAVKGECSRLNVIANRVPTSCANARSNARARLFRDREPPRRAHSDSFCFG